MLINFALQRPLVYVKWTAYCLQFIPIETNHAGWYTVVSQAESSEIQVCDAKMLTYHVNLKRLKF